MLDVIGREGSVYLHVFVRRYVHDVVAVITRLPPQLQ